MLLLYCFVTLILSAVLVAFGLSLLLVLLALVALDRLPGRNNCILKHKSELETNHRKRMLNILL